MGEATGCVVSSENAGAVSAEWTLQNNQMKLPSRAKTSTDEQPLGENPHQNSHSRNKEKKMVKKKIKRN